MPILSKKVNIVVPLYTLCSTLLEYFVNYVYAIHTITPHIFDDTSKVILEQFKKKA